MTSVWPLDPIAVLAAVAMSYGAWAAQISNGDWEDPQRHLLVCTIEA